MATVGEYTLRGIDIDKTLTVLGREENVFRNLFVESTPTSAREVRYYTRAGGFIDTEAPASILSAPRTLPAIADVNPTRQTAFVKTYFVTSQTISVEDEKDIDIDIHLDTLRELVRAVSRKIDADIYSVARAAGAGTTAVVAPWNTASYSGVNVVLDLMKAKTAIRIAGYNPEGAYLLLSPFDHQSLITWLIDGKGSSIPAFSSQRVADGVVMEILGLNVVVSTHVTADECMVIGKGAVRWKSFMPLTSAVIDDPLIGKKIRVKEEGVAIRLHPANVFVLTNTQA